MVEKRTHERVPFTSRVSVFYKGKCIASDADTRNISLKGVYVEAPRSPGVGEHCGLELQLTGQSSKLTLNIDGRVVREDAEGFGIVFNAIDLDSYFHLKNILLYNTSDPDELSQRLETGADEALPDSAPNFEED